MTTFTQLIQQRFNMVGECHDALQTEYSRRALDGVRTPEQGIKQLAVIRVALQLQQ